MRVVPQDAARTIAFAADHAEVWMQNAPLLDLDGKELQAYYDQMKYAREKLAAARAARVAAVAATAAMRAEVRVLRAMSARIVARIKAVAPGGGPEGLSPEAIYGLARIDAPGVFSSSSSSSSSSSRSPSPRSSSSSSSSSSVPPTPPGSSSGSAALVIQGAGSAPTASVVPSFLPSRSPAVPALTSPLVPGQPERLRAGLAAGGGVELSWTAPRAAASRGVYFEILRRVDGDGGGGGGGGFALLGHAPGVSRTRRRVAFADRTIPPGTARADYLVRARRGDLRGPAAPVLTVRLAAAA